MFKRFITLLTVMALLLSTFSLSFSVNASYTDDTLYGDANGDGVVNTEDARIALQMASGVIAVEDDEQLKRTDVNFDGYVTIFDARQILRGAAGLASLQPAGAFSGFDGGGIFNNEESLVAYFNAYLNKIKVVENEETKYIAATITKTEADQLDDSEDGFNIAEVELPALSFGGSAEGVAQMVRDNLTEDDKENVVTVIPYGSTDFSLVSVENEDYVSKLTVSDVFGSRASYDAELGEITIEIALPNTEVEMATQSPYAKVFNTSDMIAEQNTTLMKLIKVSSGEGASLREFKNCVLTIVVDAATSNVKSYIVTYQSEVYVSQATVGIGNTLSAKLKGIRFKKNHSVKYEDFQWPK